MTLNIGAYYCIEWWDACNWSSVTDLEELNLIKTFSYGECLKITDKWVAIAPTNVLHDGSNIVYENVIVIPISWLIKVTLLEPSFNVITRTGVGARESQQKPDNETD